MSMISAIGSFLLKALTIILGVCTNKLPNDTERKICCLGCKHFFYWNNGSAGCDLDKQYVCTHNNFILREEDNDISKLRIN